MKNPRTISGSVRGLRLQVPKKGTRPMSDRVKSSLFSIINNYIYKANVLDLYAGTGALGIECLSRGAAAATFIDNSKEAIDIIKNNVEKAGFTSLVTIKLQRVDQFLKKYSDTPPFEAFDIIFFCPPYLQFEQRYIARSAWLLKKDGILIAEHHKDTYVKSKIGKLIKIDERVYGNTVLTFFRKEE
jgi:16S rRNA (guanine966-N2)-methyltransferase